MPVQQPLPVEQPLAVQKPLPPETLPLPKEEEKETRRHDQGRTPQTQLSGKLIFAAVCMVMILTFLAAQTSALFQIKKQTSVDNYREITSNLSSINQRLERNDSAASALSHKIERVEQKLSSIINQILMFGHARREQWER